MQLRQFLAAATLAAIGAAAPGTATAATLLGKTVGVQWMAPDITTLYANFGPNLVGTDPPTKFPGDFYFSFTDTTITVSNWSYSGQFYYTPPVTFNGFRIWDGLGAINDFTSFTLAATNIAGMDASRVSFDADALYANFDALFVTPASFATFNVTTAPDSSPVPEPASWAMMLVGFGLVGQALRSRRQARVRYSFA